MKTGFDKIDINKLVNVPTSLKNLKTKGDDLDNGGFKNCFYRLKTLSYVVNKNVVRKTMDNKLKAKVNNLDNTYNGASTLIETTQCNTDEQKL